jgi:hypothetical protein
MILFLFQLLFVIVAGTNSTDDEVFRLKIYENRYNEARAIYMKALHDVRQATGPYKASRDAYITATATYTHSLYPDLDYSSRIGQDNDLLEPERIGQ